MRSAYAWSVLRAAPVAASHAARRNMRFRSSRIFRALSTRSAKSETSVAGSYVGFADPMIYVGFGQMAMTSIVVHCYDANLQFRCHYRSKLGPSRAKPLNLSGRC